MRGHHDFDPPFLRLPTLAASAGTEATFGNNIIPLTLHQAQKFPEKRSWEIENRWDKIVTSNFHRRKDRAVRDFPK